MILGGNGERSARGSTFIPESPAHDDECHDLGRISLNADLSHLRTCDSEAVGESEAELCHSITVLSSAECDLDWGLLATNACVAVLTELGARNPEELCNSVTDIEGRLADYIVSLLENLGNVCGAAADFEEPESSGVLEEQLEGRFETDVELCAGLVTCLTTTTLSTLNCEELRETLADSESTYIEDLVTCLLERWTSS